MDLKWLGLIEAGQDNLGSTTFLYRSFTTDTGKRVDFLTTGLSFATLRKRLFLT